MMVVGNVATATGTRATEIRTGRVATTTAAVGKMKIATATVSSTRMMVSAAPSVVFNLKNNDVPKAVLRHRSRFVHPSRHPGAIELVIRRIRNACRDNKA
jgi:hypothetical protein